MELNHSISSVSSISTADHTAGHDLSGGLNESREQDALSLALQDTALHWVQVLGLDASVMTSEALRTLFYHYGATEGYLTTLEEEATGKRIGFVSFADACFVDLAVEKMHGVVPSGQRGPITVERITPSAIRKRTLRCSSSSSAQHSMLLLGTASSGEEGRNPPSATSLSCSQQPAAHPQSLPFAPRTHQNPSMLFSQNGPLSVGTHQHPLLHHISNNNNNSSLYQLAGDASNKLHLYPKPSHLPLPGSTTTSGSPARLFSSPNGNGSSPAGWSPFASPPSGSRRPPNTSTVAAAASVNPIAVALQTSPTPSSAVSLIVHDVTAVVVPEESASHLRSRLQRLVVGIAAVLPTWPLLSDFKSLLVKSLLQKAFNSSSSSSSASSLVPPSTTSSNDLDVARAVQQCGTFLGLLFAQRVIEGDPFELGTRFLKEAVVTRAHAMFVVGFAQECRTMVFPRSQASFHAALADACVVHPSLEVRQWCARAMLEFLPSHHSSASITSAPSPAPRSHDASSTSSSSFPATATSMAQPANASSLTCSPQALSRNEPSELTKARCGEIKTRTVHISRLPAKTKRSAFASFLSTCGVVDKVRVCLEGGSANVFCFVEMATVEATQALLRHDGATMFGGEGGGGSAIRVRMAKAPIQDVHPSDAVMGPHQLRLRSCTFAVEGGVMLELE